MQYDFWKEVKKNIKVYQNLIALFFKVEPAIQPQSVLPLEAPVLEPVLQGLGSAADVRLRFHSSLNIFQNKNVI